MGLRIGTNGVDSRLKARMAAWYEAQVSLKAAPKTMDVDDEKPDAVPDVAVPDVAAPGIAKEPVRDGPQTEIPPSETP